MRCLGNVCCLVAITTMILTLSSTVQAGSYEAAVLADNPAGYWRLEEDVSGGAAADSAGSHNGTIAGGITNVAGGCPQCGNAMRFDGDTGIIDVQDSDGSLGSSGSAWSIEFFMRAEAGGGPHQNPVIKGHFTGAGGTFFNQTSGLGNLGFGINNGSPHTAEAPLATYDVWQHVVGTIRHEGGDTKATVYVNGALAGENTIPGHQKDNSAEPLTIGALSYGSPAYVNHFIGALDEVAVYDYELSAGQVAAHYAASVPEPSACLLLVLGLCGLIARRR